MRFFTEYDKEKVDMQFNQLKVALRGQYMRSYGKQILLHRGCQWDVYSDAAATAVNVRKSFCFSKFYFPDLLDPGV